MPPKKVNIKKDYVFKEKIVEKTIAAEEKPLTFAKTPLAQLEEMDGGELKDLYIKKTKNSNLPQHLAEGMGADDLLKYLSKGVEPDAPTAEIILSDYEEELRKKDEFKLNEIEDILNKKHFCHKDVERIRMNIRDFVRTNGTNSVRVIDIEEGWKRIKQYAEEENVEEFIKNSIVYSTLTITEIEEVPWDGRQFKLENLVITGQIKKSELTKSNLPPEEWGNIDEYKRYIEENIENGGTNK